MKLNNTVGINIGKLKQLLSSIPDEDELFMFDGCCGTVDVSEIIPMYDAGASNLHLRKHRLEVEHEDMKGKWLLQ